MDSEGFDSSAGKGLTKNTTADPQMGSRQNEPAPLPAEEDEITFESSSDDNSLSDVSMSDSDSDSDDGQSQPQTDRVSNNHATAQLSSSVPLVAGPNANANATQINDVDSKKRKSPTPADATSSVVMSNKKVKLDDDMSEGSNQPPSRDPPQEDRSLLPAEIWHRIFTFVSPKVLGKLLRVNKLFNVYLDPASPFHGNSPPCPPQNQVPRLKPDAIWQASRRRFWHKMPSPLQDKTELDMWRLACQRRCQFCDQKEPMGTHSTSDPWQGGPGASGVQIVWAFALRICGPCLVKKTIKEIDLLLSSSMPSLLVPALPFVFIIDAMHVIQPAALQDGQVPPNLQVTKIFLSEHVEKLQQEFHSVKSMGGATAEEWLKGLENRGKEQRGDSVRWEKWTLNDGVMQMRATPSRDGLLHVLPSTAAHSTPAEESSSNTRPQLSIEAEHHQQAPGSDRTPSAFPASQTTTIPTPSSGDGSLSRPQSSFQSGALANPPPRNRTREEVLELKAARRAEIERRAMELEPPLPANVLARVPAFQAAIQIISPLDANAWNLLKPRLLAQRADAEQRERQEQEVAAHSRVAQERLVERRNVEGTGTGTSLEAKQLIDKDWDETQAPLRAQISAYADEIIRDGWNEGRKINKESGPQFAVEVLLYVRRRFYAEIAKDFTAARAAGQEPVLDPPGGPFTRKLTLENMKWLFDVKIKPRTESYRKELFFCNGCEGNFKPFGFEGVVQHYAAKHTNALSLGSVVVHWRAEWPEIPPFHPDPVHLKKAQGPQNGISYGNPHPQSNAAPPQYGYNAYPPTSAPGSYQPAPYHNVPPAGYGQPGPGDKYGPPPPQQASYGYSSTYVPPLQSYSQPYPSHPLPYIPYHQGSDYAGPHGPYPGAMASGPPSYPQAGEARYDHNYNAYQSNSQFNFPPSHNSTYPDRYRTQSEDIVRNSRDLWAATAGLRELPGSMRVYVVIHHVVNRFRARFSESPPLAMFIDGLSNNKEMRPVRNINGLMCKACNLGLGDVIPLDQDKKTFSLPQLVNHFQQKHIEQLQTMGAPLLDWSVDMVYIPDLSVLANLRNLANMDSQKFSLVSDAFPMAHYPGGYSQNVPPVAPNYWAGTNPFVNSSTNDGSVPSAEQPAGYHTQIPQPGSGGRVPQQLQHEYRPSTPNLLPDPTQTDGRDYSNTDVLHPRNSGYTPPLIAAVKSQYGDSGRTSPDTRQSSHGATKSRNRKGHAKDRRNASSQGSKSRKGGAKTAPTVAKTREHSEEDTGAEEEARRQEEEIRAMWAADRRETARLASANRPPTLERTPHLQEATPEPRLSLIPQDKPMHRPTSAAYTSQLEEHQQPVVVRERDDDDDLMAGLESQLDQQQASPTYYQLRPSTQIVYARQPSYEQSRSSRLHAYAEQAERHERTHSRSPRYTRHESRIQAGQYRERSPHHAQPPYGSRAAPVLVDDLPPERYTRHEYYDAYDQQRSHRPVQYTEAYEIVQVRDSQGEYYIRRPIGREPEPVAVQLAYEEDRPTYREAAPQYGAYERESYSRQPAYEALSRAEAPLRQPLYETSTRSTSINRQAVYESLSRNDPAAYEDYDPRFPAATPNPSTGHQIRYQ